MISGSLLFALAGVWIAALALHHVLTHHDLVRRVLATNVMGAGVFLALVALAGRTELADPVPHAMVLTGIVVAVSATAVLLALVCRIAELEKEEPTATDTTEGNES